jgi:hypothetical protein
VKYNRKFFDFSYKFCRRISRLTFAVTVVALREMVLHKHSKEQKSKERI